VDLALIIIDIETIICDSPARLGYLIQLLLVGLALLSGPASPEHSKTHFCEQSQRSEKEGGIAGQHCSNLSNAMNPGVGYVRPAKENTSCPEITRSSC
jgi:hypothetical protein